MLMKSTVFRIEGPVSVRGLTPAEMHAESPGPFRREFGAVITNRDSYEIEVVKGCINAVRSGAEFLAKRDHGRLPTAIELEDFEVQHRAAFRELLRKQLIWLNEPPRIDGRALAARGPNPFLRRPFNGFSVDKAESPGTMSTYPGFYVGYFRPNVRAHVLVIVHNIVEKAARVIEEAAGI